MKGLEVLVVVPVGLVVSYLIVRSRSKAHRLAEAHLRENGVEATVDPASVPPLRLWPHNRNGDSWCRVRYPDGTEKWARVRRG